MFEDHSETKSSGKQAERTEGKLKDSSAPFLLPPDGTIRREQCAVEPAIEPRTEPTVGGADQCMDFRHGHRREVVNVTVAGATMSNAFVAAHLFPRGPAGRGDADGIEDGRWFHARSDTARGKRFRQDAEDELRAGPVQPPGSERSENFRRDSLDPLDAILQRTGLARDFNDITGFLVE